MSAPEYEGNLIRLQSEIQRALGGLRARTSPASECASLARSLPLAHSMPSSAFVDLAADELRIGFKLLSPARLRQCGIKPLRAESAEAALGTTEFVFLYCGQFRRPETQAGFLFSRSLEERLSADCVASPFDSGALHREAAWPDASEPAVVFLARHTLPAPAYREYLAKRIQFLFAQPADYLESENGPIRADPIGLRPRSPGIKVDPRLWTFEVRVHSDVDLSPPHLEAIFYLRRLRGSKRVWAFLAAQQGQVCVETARPEDADDFDALRRHCLDYLRKKGILL